MEVKKITEGMTAPQVAEVIDSNFRGIKEETDAKLSELGSEVNTLKGFNGIEETVHTIGEGVTYDNAILLDDCLYKKGNIFKLSVFDTNGASVMLRKKTGDNIYGETVVQLNGTGLTEGTIQEDGVYGLLFYKSVKEMSQMGYDYFVNYKVYVLTSEGKAAEEALKKISNLDATVKALAETSENLVEKDKGFPSIGSVIFDNEAYKIKGSGITYDFPLVKNIERSSINGDSFYIGIGDITVPVGGNLNTSCIIYREFDKDGNRITNEFCYHNSERVINIKPESSSVEIIICLSINDTSVLDGEYIFNNLSIKLQGKYNVFNLPKIEEKLMNLKGDWGGKVMATYGDSITAINNGNWVNPYSFEHISAGNGIAYKDWQWGNRVADYFEFSKHYGRGIGSQGFKWETQQPNGGSVSFIKSDGNLFDRNNSYNFDNYDGEIPSGTTKVRGCFCSWLRIINMFPIEIKDDIHLIFIMGGTNDSMDNENVSWISGDKTDIEWSKSEYYAEYGGDYNIKTLKGGIASTIMKMQAWMPNAIIVLGTNLNGQGGDKTLSVDEADKSKAMIEVSKLLGIPCIDVFGTSGINGLNSSRFITDGTHPYSELGGKYLARAVIGGIKNILPTI